MIIHPWQVVEADLFKCAGFSWLAVHEQYIIRELLRCPEVVIIDKKWEFGTRLLTETTDEYGIRLVVITSWLKSHGTVERFHLMFIDK